MITQMNPFLIDLTHTLSSEIPQWDSACGFQRYLKSDYDDCTTPVKFRVQKLEMFAGIGTHIDAPAHCFPNAETIDKIPLTQLVAPGYQIDVSKKAHEHYQISADDIIEFEKTYGTIKKNSIVIFHTGWSQFWSDTKKYRNNLIFPSVSKDAAELLLTREVNGLGIDTLSPDCADSGFPVHQLFLSAGKVIIENVANAEKIPKTGSWIAALPIKIKEGTEAPIRLIAMVFDKHDGTSVNE